MEVRTAEELLASIRTRIGDDQSDEAIALVEGVSDTLNSMKNDNNEDWKKKYEENDANWRKKYTERFFSDEPEPEPEPKPETDNTPRTFSDLFKEI